MSAIPLQKFRGMEFPLTPKSTVHLWVEMAFYKSKGPLAGRVRRVGGRWYVTVTEDNVADQVKEQLEKLYTEAP